MENQWKSQVLIVFGMEINGDDGFSLQNQWKSWMFADFQWNSMEIQWEPLADPIFDPVADPRSDVLSSR